MKLDLLVLRYPHHFLFLHLLLLRDTLRLLRVTTPAALCVPASPGPYNGGGAHGSASGFTGLGRSPSSAGYSPGQIGQTGGGGGMGGVAMGPRSNSAIDPAAVRRASVRAQYAQRSRIIATQNSPLVGLRK